MGMDAPTDSISPSRMITTPFAISGPLAGWTVPPVIAYTPGASAKPGSAPRRKTRRQRKRLDIRTSGGRDMIRGKGEKLKDESRRMKAEGKDEEDLF
jgi:hypothetical protein